MAEMKKKMYISSKREYNLKPYIEKFFERRYVIRKELESSGVDTPAVSYAKNLGLGSAGVLTNKAPVYKVLVPGYILRRVTSATPGYTTGESGIFVASSLAGVSSSGSRTPYTTQSGTVENNMMMLPCGSSTYMCLQRSAAANFEYLFIPTMMGVATGLHPSQYVVQVGTTSDFTSASGKSFDAFSGEWNTINSTTYLKMFGYYFPKLSSLGMTSNDDKTAYLNEFKDTVREFINSVDEGQFPDDEVEDMVAKYAARMSAS